MVSAVARGILVLLGALLLVGCAVSAPQTTPTPTAAPTPESSTSPELQAVRDRIEQHVWPSEYDGALAQELRDMLDRDQAARTGGDDPEGDRARTQRLREIVDEFGWPTITLVGEDGEDAAWAIAQHSDLDRDFQEEALLWLEAAVEIFEASPGNYGYLYDRVAVANGEPQLYGTQVGCTPEGPAPATPILDEAGLEERRSDAGMASYADYIAEMAAICAEVEG